VNDPVHAIVQAARSVLLKTRVVPGKWGISLGPKKKWVLVGDCCCALGALLVVSGAQAEEREKSPVHSAARELGVPEADVREFIDGFDGKEPGDAGVHGFGNSIWYEHGRAVAKELRIT
jgi:hypothetical protein